MYGCNRGGYRVSGKGGSQDHARSARANFFDHASKLTNHIPYYRDRVAFGCILTAKWQISTNFWVNLLCFTLCLESRHRDAIIYGLEYRHRGCKQRTVGNRRRDRVR